MIIGALLVFQAQSAGHELQSEQLKTLAKSQEITRCLRNLQKKDSAHSGFEYDLKYWMTALIQMDDKIYHFSDLVAHCPNDKHPKVFEYIELMHKIRKSIGGFLTSYHTLRESEQTAWSDLLRPSKEDWGDFPNPTSPMKTLAGDIYCYTNECRDLRITVYGVNVALKALCGVTECLQKLKDRQALNTNNVLFDLAQSLTVIGKDANFVAQQYKEDTRAHIDRCMLFCTKVGWLLHETYFQFSRYSDQMLKLCDSEARLQIAFKNRKCLCAPRVCPAQYAGHDLRSKQLAKLAKSQEITICLMEIQEDYQAFCYCDYKLKHCMKRFIQMDDEINRFSYLWTQWQNGNHAEVFEYIELMHKVRTSIEGFLTSYHPLSAAGTMAWSALLRHSTEDWGAFPNPTKLRTATDFFTYSCTYVSRVFERLFVSFRGVKESLFYVVEHLSQLRFLQEKQQGHLNSLAEAVARIGEDDSCVARAYKTKTVAQIDICRSLCSDTDQMLTTVWLPFFKYYIQAKQFCDVEKTLRDIMQA